VTRVPTRRWILPLATALASCAAGGCAQEPPLPGAAAVPAAAVATDPALRVDGAAVPVLATSATAPPTHVTWTPAHASTPGGGGTVELGGLDLDRIPGSGKVVVRGFTAVDPVSGVPDESGSTVVDCRPGPPAGTTGLACTSTGAAGSSTRVRLRWHAPGTPRWFVLTVDWDTPAGLRWVSWAVEAR
jgi:hypothetical protein